MNSESSGAAGSWTEAARKRGCYCGLWDTDPAHFERQGLPPGYCGKCERCGAAGHTRHYPGPVPYTGAWCDGCYRLLKWTWPLRTPQGWVYLLVLLAIVVVIGEQLLRAH